MSTQIHTWRAQNSPDNTSPTFISPINGQLFDTTEFRGTVPCKAPGTFADWSITLPSAPGAGNSLAFTLRINQVDTAAVITISGTDVTGVYAGSPIALADEDELTFRCDPTSTPTVSAPSMTWTFESTNPGESIYGGVFSSGLITTTRQNGLFFPCDNWNVSRIGVCPLNGTVTGFTVMLDADPGGGTWTFLTNKNGTDQDGGGGTPDTRLTFATGTLKDSVDFTLDVAPGDLSRFLVQDGGGANTRVSFGVRLLADTPGESIFGCTAATAFDGTSTIYPKLGSGDTNALTTVEADSQVTVATAFTLSNLYAATTAAPGSGGDTYTFTLRVGGSPTAHTVALVDADTVEGNAQSLAITANQVLSLQIAPSVTPAVGFYAFAFIQSNGGGAPPGGGGDNWFPDFPSLLLPHRPRPITTGAFFDLVPLQTPGQVTQLGTGELATHTLSFVTQAGFGEFLDEHATYVTQVNAGILWVPGPDFPPEPEPEEPPVIPVIPEDGCPPPSPAPVVPQNACPAPRPA